MNRLENKVVILTGGATGIGEAISKKFAWEGASIVVAGLPEDPVDAVVAEIRESGGIAIGYSGDLSSVETAKGCVTVAVQQFGKLNVLINNAGVFVETNFLTEYSEEAFEYV